MIILFVLLLSYQDVYMMKVTPTLYSYTVVSYMLIAKMLYCIDSDFVTSYSYQHHDNGHFGTG